MTGRQKKNASSAKRKLEFRAYISPSLYAMVKAITPLKNSGEDWNLPKVMEDALTVWLSQPENLRLIRNHNFEQMLKDRSLKMPSRIQEALNSGTPEDG